MGWTVRGSNPGRGKRFFSYPKVQINYEAHSESNSMVTGVLALGIKWTVCNADHPPPCMLGVNGASSLLLLYAFLAWTGATLSSNSVLVILL